MKKEPEEPQLFGLQRHRQLTLPTAPIWCLERQRGQVEGYSGLNRELGPRDLVREYYLSPPPRAMYKFGVWSFFEATASKRLQMTG